MAIGSNKLTDTTGIQLKADAFVVIVKTEWNNHVISILEEGCIKVLTENKVKFKVITVPGAFEIPFAVQYYWNKKMEDFRNNNFENNQIAVKLPDAFIALGCVIRGDTPHFDYVCQGLTQGLMQLNTALPVPILNGVLTVNEQVQADERTGGRNGHKGEECAAAAIKMISFMQTM